MADATRDGARQAIAEVLRDLLADPALLAVIRGQTPAVTAPVEPRPSAWARLRAAVRAAATAVTEFTTKAVAKVTEGTKALVTAASARARAVRSRVAAAARVLDFAWRVRRALLAGAGVAVLVLFACQLSHTAASMLAALGSGAVTAAAYLGLWARRTARRLVGYSN